MKIICCEETSQLGTWCSQYIFTSVTIRGYMLRFMVQVSHRSFPCQSQLEVDTCTSKRWTWELPQGNAAGARGLLLLLCHYLHKNIGERWSSLIHRSMVTTNTVTALTLPPPSEFVPLVSNTSLPLTHYPPEFISPPLLPSCPLYSMYCVGSLPPSLSHVYVAMAIAF